MMIYKTGTLNPMILVLIILTGMSSTSYCQKKYNSGKAKHLELANNNKSLFWFYTFHSVDPEDIMFQDIEQKMDLFKPDLVLIEGGASKRAYTSREHAIRNGESAFASFIASQSNIRAIDIEPPFPDQIQFLQEKYKPESILAMYLARQLGSIQLLKTGGRYDLEKLLMSETIMLIDNGLNLNRETITPDYILETLNASISKPIDAENWQGSKLYRQYASKPDKSGKAISNIYHDLVSFRDIYLVRLIKTHKEEYNRIFVVMGYGHLEATKHRIMEIYQN